MNERLLRDMTPHMMLSDVCYSGKATDIEEFRSLVTREKGDNYKKMSWHHYHFVNDREAVFQIRK